MKKILKRVSAAVIALAVAATAVVFDVPEKIVAAADGTHTKHKVCVGTTCTDCNHTEITDWQAISDASSFSSLTNGGHYYLTTNVTLTKQVEISSGVDVTLCLNGQTLTAAANSRIFKVIGSLTLCDCKDGGKLTGANSSGADDYSGGGAIWVKGGTFNMYGGTISGNTTTRDMSGGGGVFMNSSGTFNMYGGTISNNTAYTAGGGVYVSDGIFTMYDGTIQNNQLDNTNTENNSVKGGGVMVDSNGEFIMNGGTIKDNTALTEGGGVYDYGKFTMNGGTISGNKTTKKSTQYSKLAGGGVCTYGSSSTPFIMNGGTISNNTSAGSGGGVYSASKPFIMNGGTISGNAAETDGGGVYANAAMTLNGNVTITGNKSGTGDAKKDDNVYLNTNKTLTIGSSFSTASPIGITTKAVPTDGTPVDIATGVSSDLSSSFKADNADYKVVYKDNKLQLAVASSNTCGDNATWAYDDTTKTLTISGTGAMTNWISTTSVPWAGKAADIKNVVIEEGITSIGNNAFKGCSSLTSVTIPDGVDSIGSWAFDGCTELTSITIPESVTSIKNYAFQNCSKLTSITIPWGSRLANIGLRAFYNCSCLTAIDIPGSVTSIDQEAFSGCTSLTSITIPNGVTYIDANTFNGCSNLSSITIPNSVTSIYTNAFYGCSSLTAITIPNDVTIIDDRAFSGCSSLSSITIPGKVATIGQSAFSNCTSLSSITIPNSVNIIYATAFSGCTSLETVTFENATPPATIGTNLFNGCTNLAEILVPAGSAETYKGLERLDPYKDKIFEVAAENSCGDNATWAYDEATKTLTISGTGTMTDWTDTTSVPWADKAANIQKVVIEDGITSIGDNAFNGCSSLTNVTISRDVTTIGEGAFNGCSNLANVILPEGVTTISPGAFMSCTSLTGITIPKNVTTIGNNAFDSCTNLKTVTFEGTTPPTTIGSNVFNECSSDLTINVPEGKADAYKNALTGLSDKVTDGTPDNKCGANATWALDETTKTLTISGTGNMSNWVASGNIAPWLKDTGNIGKIKNVVINEGITSVGNYAFCRCLLLTSVTIPSSVTFIGDCAFNSCSALTSITIPSSVTSIGSSAFFNCGNLTSITIPKDVRSIGTSAFDRCSKLSEIIYKDGLDVSRTSIPDTATKVEYTVNNSKLNVTKITLGTGKTNVTITDAMNIVSVDKNYREKVAQTGHTHLGGTATCSDKAKCDICDAEHGEKADHNWGAWMVTTAPTLAATGTATRVCDNNSDHKEIKTLPKINLDSGTAPEGWTVQITKPTFSGAGKIEYKEGSTVVTAVTLPALNDDTVWTKKTTDNTEPGVNTGGSYTYTSNYGEVTVEVPKLSDTTVWAKDSAQHADPTKENTGKDVYKSKTPGLYPDVTVTIPALSDESKWTKTHTAPTLTADGSDVYISTEFGTVTVTIPGLADTAVWEKDTTKHKDPTLSAKGEDVYKSKTSGLYADVTAEIPALSDTSVWTKDDTQHIDPTETDKGRDVYKSKNDIYPAVTVILPELNHEHTLVKVDEVPATTESAGVKEHWHCSDCNKDFADAEGTQEITDVSTLAIPKKKVEVSQGTGAPETNIAITEEQVINAVFGNSVPAGEITIILDVKNLGDNPPSDDKTAAENKLATLSSFKLGQYLDIKLLKKVGSAAPETITNITAELTITFNIPSALLGKEKYSVIRVHNGVADVLEDRDKAPNTVTIKTDKFSTYVLTYKEKSSSSGSGGSGSSGGSSGGSGSSHRHRYIYDETIIKEPTCTESGEKTLSCSCGRTTTETVPALGHDYRGEITKPATETEDGVRTFTCTRCGDTYTEIIPKTGGESKPGDTSSGTSDNTSSGTSDDNSSGTSASGDGTSSDSRDTSSDNSGSSSGDSGASSNSGSSSGGTGEDNPITGVAAVIPLAAVIAAAAALAVTKSRKK